MPNFGVRGPVNDLERVQLTETTPAIEYPIDCLALTGHTGRSY